MARGKDSSAIPGEADGGFLTEEQERRAKAFLREREAEGQKAEREQAKEHERRQVPRGAGVSGRGSAGGGGMSPTDIEKGRQPGKVKLAKGGMVKSSASKRADGCAVKGKTKGKMV